MGGWGKKRRPLQDKDTAADTWVTSSNLYSQIIEGSSGVFNLWTTKSPLRYRTCLLWSQQTYLHIFWKVLNFVETINLTSAILVFNAYETEREKMAEIYSICRPVIPVCLFREFRSQGWPLDAGTRKNDTLDQGFPVPNQVSKCSFVWIWCIYFSLRDFWMSCTFQHVVYRNTQSRVSYSQHSNLFIKNCCFMFFRKIFVHRLHFF